MIRWQNHVLRHYQGPVFTFGQAMCTILNALVQKWQLMHGWGKFLACYVSSFLWLYAFNSILRTEFMCVYLYNARWLFVEKLFIFSSWVLNIFEDATLLLRFIFIFYHCSWSDLHTRPTVKSSSQNQVKFHHIFTPLSSLYHSYDIVSVFHTLYFNTMWNNVNKQRLMRTKWIRVIEVIIFQL